MYPRFASLLAVILFGVLVDAHPPTHKGYTHSTSYTLVDLYQGQDFFSEWSFFTGSDPTNGFVNYLSMQDAQSQGLAYVNSNGAFVMAVDSTSSVPVGGNRNSVRITSGNSYSSGLFIMDAAAMPVGCATWPAFWTVGPNWPMGGEIDVVEGVNDQPRNQMTLHSGTSNPCTVQSTQGAFTGQLLNSQCYSTQNADSGCSIADPSTTSFGYGFNNAGGGVFVLQWEPSSAISIWHFPRANIPSDITNKTPTPANWGTPTGFWSAQTCDISANFYNNQLVFDTTICGGWAQGAYGNSGCPGTCEQMVANTTNFINAKWEVNYVAVYQ